MHKLRNVTILKFDIDLFKEIINNKVVRKIQTQTIKGKWVK